LNHCLLGTKTFNLYLTYIDTVNYRCAQKAIFLQKRKKKEILILKSWSISLSSEKKKQKSRQD
jgi:hypothetical protein